MISQNSKKRPKTFAFPSLNNIAALLIKNWITMKRNLLLLLFVFFLPGTVLFINSLVIGQEPRDLPVAVVNLESNCEESFFLTDCEANLLGCYFQGKYNITILQISSYIHLRILIP